jgi:flagellar hook-associated protein 1
MSLSTAFNILSSSFSANAAQTAVVAGNIGNAGTTGYSRQIANVITTSSGGAEVASVTRVANAALTEQVETATSQAASQQAIADGMATLAATVDDSSSSTSSSGSSANGNSPSAMLASLETALTTYVATPSSTSAGDAVVTAAKALASALNSGATAVQSVREQADQNMASSVTTINSLLAQFTDANNAVVTGLAKGADVASAQDKRDSIVSQLSNEIGVSTTTAGNGSMSIYTDSGVTLFQDLPRTVAFEASGTLVDGETGAAVIVDGTPVTGANATLPIQSGVLAGYAALRDRLAPQYGAQLDQVAGGLINAFAETDQSVPATLPSLPGLFTADGLAGLPSTSAATGLAASIAVNANADPSQGGDVTRIRDGGISDPGVSAYVDNASGAASYSSHIQGLVSSLDATQSFDASAGLGASASLAGYANASVSWVQSESQQASNASQYQNALATQASSALSNATGVNLDQEMTQMLALENSYAASAKLLTTLTTMFSALLSAA